MESALHMLSQPANSESCRSVCFDCGKRFPCSDCHYVKSLGDLDFHRVINAVTCHVVLKEARTLHDVKELAARLTYVRESG
jgi:hypothetical protein